MSDIIRLLPDSVANQIAAGEVIQRPASVVKELVENSVDAGADRISVIIRDAGRTLIQVVDNGKGMSQMDARMAFERHATSKITVADDLFALNTMGFRGEALASIAAVAQVELITMQADEQCGTKLIISGSKIESQEVCAAVPGTNMMVKNLFFNVPARRKFLKKDAVELSNISREFERLALVNPDVEMTLIHNDMVMHQLLRGTLKQRIAGLFGKSMERQLVPVSTSTSIVDIDGFVGLPENARRRGALQFLFVNGRNMRHPYFHKAVMHCYEQLIPHDEQPNYFLNFTVDPSTIDVNIHPTKNEIKFENEQPIWQILVAVIKESLGRYNIVPSLDFESAGEGPEIPAFNPNGQTSTPDFGITDDYNPFVAGGGESSSQHRSMPSDSSMWQRQSRRAVDNWQALYDSFNSGQSERVEASEISDDGVVASRFNTIERTRGLIDEEPVAMQSAIEIGGKYLVTQSSNGLLVIDQRRAHIRVLYETFKDVGTERPVASQSVLFSDVIPFTPGESALIEDNEALLTSLGFELSYLGDNTWTINSIPAAINDKDAVGLLRTLVADIADGIEVTADEMRMRIAMSLARASAIAPGTVLGAEQREQLLSDLFSLSTPALTPDGLKVFVELTVDKLASLFI